MQTITVGLDIAKNTFHAVQMDARGKVLGRKQLKRHQVCQWFANLPPSRVVMEACGSSHYWGRQISASGHEVRQIPAQHVVAYRRKNKNDYNDAEAIAEASQRPNMSFVPLKTLEQQEIQALLRIRDRRISERTRLANQIQGLAAEFGVAIGRGRAAIRVQLANHLEQVDHGLPVRMHGWLSRLRDEYLALDIAIKELNAEVEAWVKENEVCQRAMTVPGIGPINAATLYASIGNGRAFRNGRHFAAWCGLVPRQNSTGGKTVLGGITKRGNRQLRQLQIHGARSALMWAEKRDKPDALLQWAVNLKKHKHYNKATVALANKLARVVWAVIAKEQPYQAKAPTTWHMA